MSTPGGGGRFVHDRVDSSRVTGFIRGSCTLTGFGSPSPLVSPLRHDTAGNEAAGNREHLRQEDLTCRSMRTLAGVRVSQTQATGAVLAVASGGAGGGMPIAETGRFTGSYDGSQWCHGVSCTGTAGYGMGRGWDIEKGIGRSGRGWGTYG